jgi:hypothetical protein
MQNKLVEAAAEFLSRDTSTKQDYVDFENDDMYIKLLSPQEFDKLTEEDQNVYIDAIEQLQELSPETLRSYQKKAGKSVRASFKNQKNVPRGSPEAKADAVKTLNRMSSVERAKEKEDWGTFKRMKAAK